jgi:hypothetical protein
MRGWWGRRLEVEKGCDMDPGRGGAGQGMDGVGREWVQCGAWGM